MRLSLLVFSCLYLWQTKAPLIPKKEDRGILKASKQYHLYVSQLCWTRKFSFQFFSRVKKKFCIHARKSQAIIEPLAKDLFYVSLERLMSRKCLNFFFLRPNHLSGCNMMVQHSPFLNSKPHALHMDRTASRKHEKAIKICSNSFHLAKKKTVPILNIHNILIITFVSIIFLYHEMKFCIVIEQKCSWTRKKGTTRWALNILRWQISILHYNFFVIFFFTHCRRIYWRQFIAQGAFSPASYKKWRWGKTFR